MRIPLIGAITRFLEGHRPPARATMKDRPNLDRMDLVGAMKNHPYPRLAGMDLVNGPRIGAIAKSLVGEMTPNEAAIKAAPYCTDTFVIAPLLSNNKNICRAYRYFGFFLLIILLLSTLSESGLAKAHSLDVQTELTEPHATVIARHLDVPWTLTFFPDGQALIGERYSGRLLVVSATGHSTEFVHPLREMGMRQNHLLGLALSPDYIHDQQVYAYLRTRDDYRVLRFQAGSSEQPQVLLQVPFGKDHHAGHIAFGPDGKLYIGTGDAGKPERSQDLALLNGKVLRINPDGSIPADNPFEGSPVYAYGFRNVQGLTWDNQGQLYITDIGHKIADEINRVVRGGNHGWPHIEGTGNDPRYIDPVATLEPAKATPSGIAFLNKGGIPQWQDSFLISSLMGKRLWRLKLYPDHTILETLLDGVYGRLRNIAQAPDGSIWLLTSNHDGNGTPVPEDDRIIRIAMPGK